MTLIIKPELDGLSKFLGTLETSVMVAFWAGATTFRQAYTHITQNDNEKLAESSVVVTINRLTAKGYLIREKMIRKSSKTNPAKYRPRWATEEDFIRSRIEDTLKGVSNDYADLLLDLVVAREHVDEDHD